MIYEIALWFRNRGHSVTRNEIVGNLMIGFFMIACSSLLVFMLISASMEFQMMVIGGVVGIFAGVLFGDLICESCYPHIRFNPLAISIGLVLGAATVTGFFALLPVLWILVIPIIILAEVLFLVLDGREPSPNESVFWFTAKRKLHVLTQAAIIMLSVFGFWKGGKEFISWAIINWHAVKMFFGVVGSVVVVIVVLYLYIKLNSLKYNRNGERQQPVPQPPQQLTTQPPVSKMMVAPRPAGRSRATTPKRSRAATPKFKRIRIGTLEERPLEPEFQRIRIE